MANYCQDSLPQYADNNCEVYQLGGISHVAIIEPGNPYEGQDLEDITVWNNMIANGYARIISGINAQTPDPSPVETANPKACGPDNIKIKMNNTITINDANVSSENDAFYAALDGRETYAVVYYCQENNMRYIARPITWSTSMPTAPDQNSFQSYKVTGTFVTPKNYIPELLTAPAGLFV